MLPNTSYFRLIPRKRASRRPVANASQGKGDAQLRSMAQHLEVLDVYWRGDKIVAPGMNNRQQRANDLPLEQRLGPLDCLVLGWVQP